MMSPGDARDSNVQYITHVGVLSKELKGLVAIVDTPTLTPVHSLSDYAIHISKFAKDDRMMTHL